MKDTDLFMNESTFTDVLSSLDLTVMKRIDAGLFQLVGATPDWLSVFLPLEGSGKDKIRPAEIFPFLEHFLDEAEEIWNSEKGERLRSGTWLESDSAGEEYAFEATAFSIGEKKVLVIRLDGQSFAEKQFAIQKGRDLALSYHRLDRLKEKLREQNVELRKLTQALEQSANTVVITDLKGNIEYVNPKFVETTGYEVDEALGQNTRMLKSGEQSDDFYSKMWDVISSGREWRGEFHNKRKDGTMYWELATIAPVYDAEKKITNFIAVKEDITARKQAEDIAGDINRCLLGMGPDYKKNINRVTAIIGWRLGANRVFYDRLEGDMISHVGDWNAPSGRVTVSKGEGLISFDLIRDDVRECKVIRNLQSSAYARTDPAIRDLGVTTYAGQAVRLEGRPVGALCALFEHDRILSESETHFFGTLAGILATEEERNAAKEALRRGEEEMRAIVEGTSPVIGEDFFRAAVHHLTLALEAPYAYIGELEEKTAMVRPLVFQADGKFIEFDAFGIEKSPCERTVRDGEAFFPARVRELFPENPFLEEKGIESYWAFPLKASYGKVIGLICLMNNKTMIRDESAASIFKIFAARAGAELERLQTERELMRKDRKLEAQNLELERLNRLKSDLIAITSHDMRSPLSAIIGYANLMKDTFDELTDRKMKTYLDRIISSGSQLVKFIGGILDAQKIESGKFEIDPCRLLLEPLIRSCVETNSIEAKRKEIRISLEVRGRPGPALIDKGRMEQVLNNIISNAIKFSPKGKQIELVYTNEDGASHIVSICDWGPGIPEEDLDAIFDRYFQVKKNGPVTKRGFGSGLGLYIAKNIVELHHGSIQAENRMEGGCCFVFKIPNLN